MRLALCVHDQQMATVADFSQELWLIGDDAAHGVDAGRLAISGDQLCELVAGHGVTILLCGAISRCLHQRLTGLGIEVLDGCTGLAETVLADWRCDRLSAHRSALLCCGRGLRRRRRRHQARVSSPTRSPQESSPMRIAISANGADLDAALDPRFGRCAHLLVCDLLEGSTVHHANPVPAVAEHGAGIRTAEFVAGLGVGAVITGALGPKAQAVLKAAGIRGYAAPAGSARDALAAYTAGTLVEIG